jgi:hypothetical protein
MEIDIERKRHIVVENFVELFWFRTQKLSLDQGVVF